jgi:N-acetylglucosamine-6-phosphate deacetylase
MTVLGNARVVTPDAVVEGWLRIDGDRIAGVGAGTPPAGDDVTDAGGAYLLPGFIDLHVHGGGGASMTSGDRDPILAALAYHRSQGTTRSLVSTVTAPVETLERACRAVAELVADPGHGFQIAGTHLEGPFLSEARCGAQSPEHLLPPDPAVLDRLITAGDGSVRMVTIAPELAGGVELVKQAVAAGLVAAVGHTDATYDQATAGIEAGATVATHLFNGMRPLHHREPGPVGAALSHPEVVCEVVNDGVHLHGAVVRTVFAAAGSDRVALITDAMQAAGYADGLYPLGPQQVRVSDGVARLVSNGAIAGSTLSMGGAVRRAAGVLGLPLVAVARAAATVPARVLGLAGKAGALVPGAAADVVALDDEYAVRAVMVAGRWVHGTV